MNLSAFFFDEHFDWFEQVVFFKRRWLWNKSTERCPIPTTNYSVEAYVYLGWELQITINDVLRNRFKRMLPYCCFWRQLRANFEQACLSQNCSVVEMSNRLINKYLQLLSKCKLLYFKVTDINHSFFRFFHYSFNCFYSYFKMKLIKLRFNLRSS